MNMFQGVLTKMKSHYNTPIQYYLEFEKDFLHMNSLLGKKLEIQFLGHECLNCHLSKPIFRQGFCKNCFFEIPSAGDWIMRPELSKAHLDIEDRDLAFEKKVQLQPHIVYLAVSSNLKVGVTRKSQIPTRWIDQGATSAIPIIEAPNRYLAGITEVALKGHYADKTNWRQMLQQSDLTIDLQAEKEHSLEHLPKEVKPYIVRDIEPLHFQFPVESYPDKVKSLNLEKAIRYQGKLIGIKGQYLIFEDQTVFNIRSNEGVVARFSV